METTKNSATTRDVLLVFWRHARKYKSSVFLILGCILLATALDAAQPWFYKMIFDTLGSVTPAVATIAIFLPALSMMIATRALGWLLWRVIALSTDRFQPNVMVDLEQSSFEYLLGHSYRFFADHFGGSLVKKIGRLSRAFERLADEIEFQLLPTVVIVTGSTIVLALRFPPIAIAFLLWCAVFVWFNVMASRWAVQADIERARLDSEAGGVLADAITNAITIKLFPSGGFEAGRFRKANRAYADAQTIAWDRHELINATQGMLMIGIDVTLMWVGIVYWKRGVLTLGDLALIQTSLGIVFRKLWDIGRSFRHVYDSFADGKEMAELLLEPHEVRDRRGAKAIVATKGQIEFDDVTFCFQKTRCVLERFNLTIKPKEKVALVGPSGAGKTTITKLLFRFYDVDEGRILIDGQDIARATQDSLRDQISLVPQEPILFHRTLMENIRYGRQDATDEEVREAAKRARCDIFIDELPDGYGTYVGERGVKLSGGERQRVAIARAIVKNAPILVLDEATSSLDSESERLIQDALHELMKDKTVIVVAHRLSTIMEMDRILVIEGGKISAQGTHKELLKKKGTYRKLWDIQAGGFAE